MSRYLLGVLILAAMLATAPVHALSPEAIDGAATIDAVKAKGLFEQGVPFVDARNDQDWEAGRVPGAYHLDIKKTFTEQSLGEVIKKGDEVVIYCNGPKCMRSTEACKKAVGWGYSKVYFFRTGFPSWKEAGYPIE